MTGVTGAKSAGLPLYPRRYFDLSPTWFRWNRLTAHDVHTLRSEPGFEGQNIFFHLNHPIRFVRVVGVVVEIECFAAGKYTILHLDDGSGACIAVRLTRILAENQHGDEFYGRQNELDGVTDPDATTIENVRVTIKFGLPTIFVNGIQVDVGSVLRVKGTISTWRDAKQLDVKIVALIKDTREESVSWMDTAQWKWSYLMTPWALTKTAMMEYDERVRKEQLESAEKAARKCEKRKAFHERRVQYELAYEHRRRKEEKKMDKGALAGTNIIREPWD